VLGFETYRTNFHDASVFPLSARTPQVPPAEKETLPEEPAGSGAVATWAAVQPVFFAAVSSCPSTQGPVIIVAVLPDTKYGCASRKVGVAVSAEPEVKNDALYLRASTIAGVSRVQLPLEESRLPPACQAYIATSWPLKMSQPMSAPSPCTAPAPFNALKNGTISAHVVGASTPAFLARSAR
jgi:hypothetical protein